MGVQGARAKRKSDRGKKKKNHCRKGAVKRQLKKSYESISTTKTSSVWAGGKASKSRSGWQRRRTQEDRKPAEKGRIRKTLQCF